MEAAEDERAQGAARVPISLFRAASQPEKNSSKTGARAAASTLCG